MKSSTRKGGLKIFYVHTAIVKIKQHKNIIQYQIQNYILYRSCSTQFGILLQSQFRRSNSHLNIIHFSKLT